MKTILNNLGRKLGTQTVIVWFILTVIALSAAVAFESTRTKGNAALDAPVESISANQRARPNRVEAEIITVQRTGFDPSEINRPPGPFTLHVNNRSEIPELDLQLDREVGERLQTASLPRSKLDWKKTIDLPPGRYILREANHPNWVCRINITPR